MGTPYYPATPSIPALAPDRFPLRALSTGEVLDRTISVYRANFWFCTALSLITSAVSLLSGVARLVYLRANGLSAASSFMNQPALLVLTIVSSLISLLLYGLTQAAISWGIGSMYLGRPATLSGAVRLALQHWVRYPLLSVAMFLIAGWPSILCYSLFLGGIFIARSNPLTVGIIAGLGGLLALLSLPYSVYRYTGISLSMAASVLEGLSIRDAMRRSRQLLPDRKGRVFLVFLVAGIFYLVLSTIIGLLSLFALRSGESSLVLSQIISLLLVVAANLILQPLLVIAFVVLYYDERVRREGFDIQFLMSEAEAHGARPEPPAAAAPFAEPIGGGGGTFPGTEPGA